MTHLNKAQWTTSWYQAHSELRSLVWEEREQIWARMPRQQHPKRGSCFCSRCRQVILGSTCTLSTSSCKTLEQTTCWTSATHSFGLTFHISFSMLFCIIVVYLFIGTEGQRVELTPRNISERWFPEKLHVLAHTYRWNCPLAGWFLSKLLVWNQFSFCHV